MYVVNAGDLQVVTPGNSLMKYTDDTYLVIPACNVDSRDKKNFQRRRVPITSR